MAAQLQEIPGDDRGIRRILSELRIEAHQTHAVEVQGAEPFRHGSQEVADLGRPGGHIGIEQVDVFAMVELPLRTVRRLEGDGDRIPAPPLQPLGQTVEMIVVVVQEDGCPPARFGGSGRRQAVGVAERVWQRATALRRGSARQKIELRQGGQTAVQPPEVAPAWRGRRGFDAVGGGCMRCQPRRSRLGHGAEEVRDPGCLPVLSVDKGEDVRDGSASRKVEDLASPQAAEIGRGFERWQNEQVLAPTGGEDADRAGRPRGSAGGP